MKMKKSFVPLILFFFLLQNSLCQQSYLGNEECSTTNSSSISKGYVCNTHYNSCDSFLTFKSRPPLNYDSPIKIANLLDSQATNIAYLNTLPSPQSQIPNDSLVIVPVPCSCSGSIYQHNTHYTVKRGDDYTVVVRDVYQGLTTCQALIGQNYYDETSLAIGSQLLVPVRCACPTAAQEAGGVTSLLVYMVESGDSFESVAKEFGVDVQSILKANKLKNSSRIYPFKPILVPLKIETCKVNSLLYFCSKDDDGLNEGGDRGSKLSYKLVIAIGVGSGILFLIVLLIVYKVYHFLKKRRRKFNKEKFFNQNGGTLLERKLQGMEKNVKIFTKGELKRATDNYNHSRFLGQGGYGTVYKGNLRDGTIVAIKRSNQIDRKWIEQFINEVIALSQINHRNIVKILGCCFETKFPLLVYEFVSNRTLSYHIHKKGHEDSSLLSWEVRLRIASEVAGAIAYMHSAASIPIFHRDIKSSNTLLDHNYNAKVSDFGTSRFVPYDQSHLTTKVQGTFGYIDPEYFRSSQLTEKSDVYSFGVLMVELLTGKQPFSFARDEGKNLLDYFISLEKDNELFEILDDVVAREAKIDDVNCVAKLAITCLRLNGKRRPTMKQVFLELEGLRKYQDHYQENQSSGSFTIPKPNNVGNSYEDLTDDSIVSLEIETL